MDLHYEFQPIRDWAQEKGIYDKGDPKTSLDWDMKNQSGITISSGIYIIHVNVPGVGEKVVKWFGVLRPIDLDTF